MEVEVTCNTSFSVGEDGTTTEMHSAVFFLKNLGMLLIIFDLYDHGARTAK